MTFSTPTTNAAVRFKIGVPVQAAINKLEKSPSVFAYRALEQDLTEYSFGKNKAMNMLSSSPEVAAYLTLREVPVYVENLLEHIDT